MNDIDQIIGHTGPDLKLDRVTFCLGYSVIEV